MRHLRPVQLLACLLLFSCIAGQPYHDLAPPGPGEPAPEPICSGDPESTCSTAYVENHPEYVLGFVEFDDLGWAWDRNQGRVLLKELKDEESELLEGKTDLLMVVFVHGWKHNASACDTNVTCFRETLRGLYATEKRLAEAGREERRIVGIYVGWRGDSSRGKVLKQTTFYGRKSTAHKVGSGAVTELLVRLDEVRHRKLRANKDSATRLIIVGHSFGGALTFSATSQLMMQHLVVADERGGPVRGVGDLVVLVNPAFEAARYQPLHQTVNEESNEEYSSEQRPVFAIFTSVGDTATSKAFPLGRFFSAKLDDYRDDGLRSLQRDSNRAAIGHFEPFRTHFLEVNDGTPPPYEGDDGAMATCGCPFLPSDGSMAPDRDDRAIMKRLARERLDTGGTRMTFPTATLVYEEGPQVLNRDKISPFSPIQVVAVDDRIITKHVDIYRPAFIDFLRYYIMMWAEP